MLYCWAFNPAVVTNVAILVSKSALFMNPIIADLSTKSLRFYNYQQNL